jgi:hypothetical protein
VRLHQERRSFVVYIRELSFWIRYYRFSRFDFRMCGKLRALGSLRTIADDDELRT